MVIFFKKLTRFSPLVLLILFIIILGTIIITINKGFDFTDEGGFLLSYANVDIYRGGIYNYHIIINKLTDWLNLTIVGYRWISLILTIISSLVLTIGLQKWLRKSFKTDHFFHNFFLLFGFISVGNFLFYFPGLLTLYNNTLTNLILQVSTGLLLYLLSIRPDLLVNSNRNRLFLFIIGFLCAFSFFIKFPTGILQIGLYLISFLFFLRNETLKERAFVFLLFALGIAVGIQCYFLFFQGINEWRFNFIKEYHILSDHSSISLLKKYFFEVISLIKFSLKNFSWLLVFPSLLLLKDYFKNNYPSKKRRIFRNLILLISVVIFLYQIYTFKFFRSLFSNQAWINAYFYLIIIAFQVVLIIALKQSKKNNLIFNWNKILVLFILLSTPVIGAMGTANPIFSNSLIHSATWFGVIVILSIYLSDHINRIIIVPIFILIPSLVTTSQVVDGNLFAPYYSVFNQNKANFFQQTEQVEDIPLLDGIYIDEKTKKFLLELNQILNENKFKPGDPILGFHIPGVVYLMEGISPGVPYYYNKDRDRKAIKTLELENIPPIILLSKGELIDNKLLMEMKVQGINFPQEYVQKGEVYFPNTDSNMIVYFPKNYHF